MKTVTLPLIAMAFLEDQLRNKEPELLVRLGLIGWIMLAVSALVSDGLTALPFAALACAGVAFTRYLLNGMHNGGLW
ncbi:hypothetical protein [Actinomadura oligospora]|uniref:hypothetical protein n=1 Tax=Actinomadura oligospora TaxID=111804 RepID=UPI00047E4DDD|nr:hypothetical protein [Actinomadura oligospora]